MEKQDDKVLKEMKANLPEFPKETLLKLYGIKDKKVGFIQIIPYSNDLVALRQFADITNKFGSALNEHPEDFEIYYIGTLSQDTGELKSEIKFLGNATSYFDATKRKAYEVAMQNNLKPEA